MLNIWWRRSWPPVCKLPARSPAFIVGRAKWKIRKEWLCLIKTREELFEKVEAAIKKMHSYETPEIIAVPIVKGSKEYLIWLDD